MGRGLFSFKREGAVPGPEQVEGWKVVAFEREGRGWNPQREFHPAVGGLTGQGREARLIGRYT